MNEPTISLTTTGDILVDGTPSPLHVVMEWSIYEPHIVSFDLCGNENEARWELDRQMIAQSLHVNGLVGAKGGNVQVGGDPLKPAYVMVLDGVLPTGEDAKAYIRIPRVDVQTLIDLAGGECGINSPAEQKILSNIVDELIEVSRGWTL